MVIYTRTGDAGTTVLSTGQHMSKTYPRAEAYGTSDELNAVLSLRIHAAKNPQHWQLLENIRLQLSWFSAELASENEEPTPEQRYISPEEIAALEAAIDTVMGRVPPLCSFILLGRSEAASRLHFTHTLACRAERRLVELSTGAPARHVLVRYTNRLSDCLYVLARAEDHDAHQNDIIQKVAERYLAAVQAPATRGPTVFLSFQELHQLIRTAVTRAEEPQVPIVISVVDANGTQMVTWRIPGALLVNSELIPKKAWTAMAMKIATHELTSVVQPGAAPYGLESHMQGKVVTFGGGYALRREGLLLGGLGISGGSVEQDMDIVEAAITAISVRTHQ